MEKAKQKVLKDISKINDANYKIFQKKFNSVFGLKKNKLKDIDVRKTHSQYQMMLHCRTHHYKHCTQYVLDLITDFQKDFKFIKLSLNSKNDWTILDMYLYWDEYLNELTSSNPTWQDLRTKPDYSGVQELLLDINLKNEKIIEKHLNRLLKRKEKSMTSINDEIKVVLKKNTFNNFYSRQNFQEFCEQLRKKYKFIEIFHTEKNCVLIRVWWNIYFNPVINNHSYNDEPPVKEETIQRKPFETPQVISPSQNYFFQSQYPPTYEAINQFTKSEVNLK